MPVDITALEFKDEYTGTGVAGTNFLMGSIMDKMYVIIDISIHWESLNVKLKASVANSSFTRFDNVKWSDVEFRVGDEIEIANYGANDGTYTITAMTDNVITVTPAPANSATDNSVDVYGTTQITNLDFYYNLIKNSESPYFVSTVDRETVQKYGNEGILDSAAGAGTVNLIAETKSFGWVNGSGTVENTGLIGRQQTFRIEQNFKISPYFLYSQLERTDEGLYPPDYFSDDECLKYVCRIDARPVKFDPEVVHSSVNGTGEAQKFKIGNDGWFNEFLNGKAPDYTLVSVAYVDQATALPLNRVDFNKLTDVTIVINSAAGSFLNAGGGYAFGSEIIIGMIYLPLAESRYVNTQRTMDENFLLDRVFTTIGGAVQDGDEFGTDYQTITDLTVTWNSVNQVTIDFTVDYSAAIKTLFEGVDESDRNYLIYATPQKYAATKLIQTDRNAVLCAVDNCDWNRDDATQSSIIGGDTEFFEFPNTTTNPTTDIKMWITDSALSKTQLLVKKGSQLTDLIFEVIAIDPATDESFVLDTFAFNFTGLYGDDFKITQPIILSKGYKLDDSDERNIILFENVPALDTATHYGYQVNYAFKLRWEQWRKIQTYNKVFTGNNTQNWSIYSAYPAWEVQLLMTRSVYDPTADYSTEFVHDSAIVVKDQNFSDDGFGNPITQALTVSVGGASTDGTILFDEDVLVKITFTGTDFTAFPPGMASYYGILYIDIEMVGGEKYVDECSSELANHADSIWGTSATLVVANATTITLSATIDHELVDKQILRYLIYGKLGYKQ